MLHMWKVGPYGQKLLEKAQEKGSRNAVGVSKRKWRTVSSWLVSNNVYSVFISYLSLPMLFIFLWHCSPRCYYYKWLLTDL